jgi:flagellar basal-body rod protein FlgF
MGNGIYSAVAGSIAQLRNLDVLSNNLAHINTPGFKADGLQFREVFASAKAGAHFVDTPAAYVRMSQGSLRRTDNPMDIAIVGDAFLTVNTDRGARLTRDGKLLVGADGLLRTTGGHSVEGDSGPIRIPHVSERESSGPIVIDKNGRVSVGDEVFGKIKLVQLDSSRLKKEGQGLYRVPSDVNALALAERVEILQGHLEDANVNPVVVMTQIIEVQRNFEALQQVVRTYREIDGLATRRML